MTCTLVRTITIMLAVLLATLTSPAQAQNPAWCDRYGGDEDQGGEYIATDGSGNSIVVGTFEGTIDFGGGPLIGGSNGHPFNFLAKFGPDGSFLWSKSLGPGAWVYGLAVDGAGNIILEGCIWGTVDFGGGALTSAGSLDVFLVKFDAGGAHLWSKHFGNYGSEYAGGVAVDSSGNVIFTGLFGDTIDFGGGMLTAPPLTWYDIFLVKLDPSGAHLWSKSFPGWAEQWAAGVEADGSGNVILTGEFKGTIDLGEGVYTSYGDWDVFLAKFDPSGALAWSFPLGGFNDEFALGAGVDRSGNIVITGNFEGTTDFGGGPLVSAGGEDIFLAKFDASGTHLWSQRFGDTAEQDVNDMVIDGTGSIAITGSFEGSIDFGGGPLTSAGGRDIFLAECDAGGAHIWSRAFGEDSFSQLGRGVTTDSSGDVMTTGAFEGSVDLGCGGVSSLGGMDIYLAKFSVSQSPNHAPGSLVAWGNVSYGQCSVPAPNDDFVAEEGGTWHSLGLRSDGSVAAWGDNSNGECTIPSPNADLTAVSGGYGHSLGLKSDGSIVGWGYNYFGQCTPPAPNADFTAIAAGSWFSLGLKSDGSIVGWGYNVSGQCNVPLPNQDFVAVSASDDHGLGLKSDGSVVAWGGNDYGQCNVPSPNSGFVAVAAGHGLSLGLKSDGSIAGWGDNRWGQCDVPLPNSDFVKVSAGWYHGLGVRSDGSLDAWGYNGDGECDAPPGIYLAVSAGGFHNLGRAILTDTTPPASVMDLEVIDATPTSLTLQWTATGDDGGIGRASAYELRYSTDSGALWESMMPVPNEPSPQPAGTPELCIVDVSGFIPGSGTVYYWRLQVADEVPNSSGPSNEAAGTPDDAVPDLAFGGLQHFSLGGADLAPEGDSMRINDLGNGGQDGAAVKLDDLNGVEIDFGDGGLTFTPADAGAELSIKLLVAVPDEPGFRGPGDPLKGISIGLVKKPGNGIQGPERVGYTTHFGDLGAVACTLVVRNHGVERYRAWVSTTTEVDVYPPPDDPFTCRSLTRLVAMNDADGDGEADSTFTAVRLDFPESLPMEVEGVPVDGDALYFIRSDGRKAAELRECRIQATAPPGSILGSILVGSEAAHAVGARVISTGGALLEGHAGPIFLDVIPIPTTSAVSTSRSNQKGGVAISPDGSFGHGFSDPNPDGTLPAGASIELQATGVLVHAGTTTTEDAATMPGFPAAISYDIAATSGTQAGFVFAWAESTVLTVQGIDWIGDELRVGGLAQLHSGDGVTDLTISMTSVPRLRILSTSSASLPDPADVIDSSSVGAERPFRLSLWPNPGAGRVQMRFELPAQSRLEIDVFDVTGRHVRSLTDGSAAAGVRILAWDGRSDTGLPASPGLYFVRGRMEAPGHPTREVQGRFTIVR